jgi:exodeoxyribonuclease-5
LAHDRSLLVEAGAGSGKTSLIAGRIATMLANGISPRSVAAVTFTELAARELLYRVRQVVDELLSGTVPKDLRAILPNGLTASEVSHLLEANACIDEITCTTIHGFCQRLIKPYPVEANIDPGASITDRGEAEGIFDDLLDLWLREQLAEASGSLVAEMVLLDPTTPSARSREWPDLSGMADQWARGQRAAPLRPCPRSGVVWRTSVLSSEVVVLRRRIRQPAW